MLTCILILTYNNREHGMVDDSVNKYLIKCVQVDIVCCLAEVMDDDVSKRAWQ